MTENTLEFAIVMPLRNDWESFSKLCKALDQESQKMSNIIVDIHVIDDYSIPDKIPEISTKHIRRIFRSRLVRNLGHQRAIAIGLVKVAVDYDYDYICVMDADGEDCPGDMFQLLEMAVKNPDAVVVAQRKRRSESYLFRIFYTIYKQIFAILTGKVIDFGNFCVIPQSHIGALINQNNLWNHLASTLVSSRIPLVKLPTQRCKRYLGQSSMNFTALVVHGLSAVSLFLEEITVRILILSLIVGFLATGGIVAVILIRLFTELAIPGWATSAVGILSIVLGQAILFIFFVVLTILQARSNFQVVDHGEISGLIANHEIIFTT